MERRKIHLLGGLDEIMRQVVGNTVQVMFMEQEVLLKKLGTLDLYRCKVKQIVQKLVFMYTSQYFF